jgi:hypothetical protein
MALTIVTSFLVYATLRLHGRLDERLAVARQVNTLAPLGLIALSLSSSIPLWDGYVVRSFPYEELVHDLRQALAGDAPFPPLPEQCSVLGDCYFIQGELRAPQSAFSPKNFCTNTHSKL